jgi:hypothetical protein
MIVFTTLMMGGICWVLSILYNMTLQSGSWWVFIVLIGKLKFRELCDSLKEASSWIPARSPVKTIPNPFNIIFGGENACSSKRVFGPGPLASQEFILCEGSCFREGTSRSGRGKERAWGQ